MNAAKTIADAIIGNDFQTIVVNEKPYTIYPPTIHRIAGAISCLSSVNIGECNSFADVFSFCKDSKQLSKALSWMIGDNESLCEELSQGTLEEIVQALSVAFSLISTSVFSRAVNLMRSVNQLAAKEKL